MTFQMVAQHIFLSLGVAALAVTPAAIFAQFGVETPPAPGARVDEATVRGRA